MRLRVKYLVAVSSLLICWQYGFCFSVCSRVGAITECGEGKLDQLDVAGKATLRGTNILENTHVAGMLNATDAVLNTLHVAGKASLIRTTVNGVTKISGLLISCETRFNPRLTVVSDKTYFDHSETNEIDVNPGGDIQVVYLGNKTVVQGNINFSSGDGLVVIDSTSKINGRVVGGYTIQKKFDNHCEGVKNK